MTDSENEVKLGSALLNGGPRRIDDGMAEWEINSARRASRHYEYGERGAWRGSEPQRAELHVIKIA